MNAFFHRAKKIAIGYFILTIFLVKKDFSNPTNIIIAILISLLIGLIISALIYTGTKAKNLLNTSTKGKEQ